MSVIIRLQNLPWSANALDIRQYFNGLSIPEGGVHIVGGELGDAFIAFSTDEDARQAFNRNNGTIKEVQIKLMLSSRTEMQKVIEAARKQSLAAFMQNSSPAAVAQMPIIPSAIPELKKSDDERVEKRDRNRSRSKSRERKDRSRERDRRDRHSKGRRSRSRSRDRRDRRRRERSRSRDRTRSKERDRRDRSRERRRSNERMPNKDSKQIGVWESPKNSQQQPNINFTSTLTSIPNLPLLAANFQQSRNTWPLNILNPTQNENLKQVATSLLNRFNQQTQQQKPNYQNQYQQNDRFNNRNDNYSNNDPQQQIEFRNCCVSLRPYYGGYGEIRRFFQGIFIHNTGIKFVNDDNGKRTGIVYVRFAYPEGKEQALQRNGNMLKSQISEVLHLDDEEFESAVDRFQPEYQDSQDSQDNTQTYRNRNTNYNNTSSRPPNNFTCVTVEDLPNFVKEQDILKMFSDYSLMSMFIVNRPRKNAVAYVKFRNAEDAQKAYDDTSKHIIDTKEVTVKVCREDDFEEISREQNELMDNMDKDNYVEADSNCVLLSGLPIKTNDRDITDIFSDVGIIPDNIHLINGSMGFNGEAFCEFCSIQDAQIALEKDGMPLGSSIISVKCVPKTEMEAILGIRSQQHNLPPKMNNNNNQRPPPYFPPRNFLNNGPRLPPNLFGGLRPPMQQQQIRRFIPPMLPQLSSSQNHPNDMMLGPPGCTVLMENVPYKAGLDEILDFFNDFDILPDNILRKFNPNGKPSGETKVIFCNADDAFQAVEQKNRQKIRDRTIYLSLC